MRCFYMTPGLLCPWIKLSDSPVTPGGPSPPGVSIEEEPNDSRPLNRLFKHLAFSDSKCAGRAFRFKYFLESLWPIQNLRSSFNYLFDGSSSLARFHIEDDIRHRVVNIRCPS